MYDPAYKPFQFPGTVFTQIVAEGYYYFFTQNKDKALQLVPHCDIIQGSTTIKFYTHVRTSLV